MPKNLTLNGENSSITGQHNDKVETEITFLFELFYIVNVGLETRSVNDCHLYIAFTPAYTMIIFQSILLSMSLSHVV